MDVEFDDEGGATVEIDPSKLEQSAVQAPFDGNLVEQLSDEVLSRLATIVKEAFDADKSSREKWEQTISAGLELLGTELLEKNKEDWECDVVHPLIIENACKFQAKCIQELWPAAGPVKTVIIGQETPEKLAKATRVKKYMNWQVEEQMEEFYDDTEKLLLNTALFGTGIRKFYYDGMLARPIGEMTPITKFFVNYAAPDIRRANRTTEVIDFTPNDFNKLLSSGFYMLDGEYQPTAFEIDELEKKIAEVIGVDYVQDHNEGHRVYEQHVYLDIEEDPFRPEWGTAPYIITYHEASSKIIGIRRNWKEGDPLYRKLAWYVCRNFVPGMFGPYGLGLIHLLGQITQTASFSLRSLIDAGRFANLQAGFKDKRVKIAGSKDPLAPGEFRDVEVGQMLTLKDGLMPAPFKEPSQTLFQLTQYIVGAGQKFADSQDQVVSDSTNYGPVGTTMALLEASTRFYSSIHKRMHRAQKEEFRILSRLNSEHLPSQLSVPVNGEMLKIGFMDFQGEIDVIPVSDPNTPSQAQRAALSQAILSVASQNPSIHDMREVFRKFYTTLGVEDVDKLVPPPNEPQPKEPLEDILAAMQGQPIKAFPGQDHEAHMEVKDAFVKMPENQNPTMQPFVAAIVANIREHLALRFGELLMALHQQNPQMAQGMLANQVLQFSLAEARSRANQKLLMDPMFQLEAKQVEQADNKLKKDLLVESAKAQLKSRELDIKEDALTLEAAEKVNKAALSLETARNQDARAQEKNAIAALAVEAKEKQSD